MKRQATIACPWCGRPTPLARSGVLPRHKRIVGAIPSGPVIREWCDGGGELPYMLSPERRAILRTQWRDEGGELIGGDE